MTTPMKSIRFNKNIRADIVQNIEKAYIEENPEPLVMPSITSVLQKALWQFYLEEVKPIKEAFKANPVLQRYETTTSYMYARMPSGATITIYEEGDTCIKERFLSLNTSSSYCWDWEVTESKGTPVVPALIQEVLDTEKANKKIRREQNKKLEAWQTEADRYIRDITQIIDGCNTSGQLLQIWPEVEKFLPRGATNPSRIQLPSVNIAELNRKLGK